MAGAKTDHPALRAWYGLGFRSEPVAIDTILEDSRSQVYRLVRAAGGDRNVIAKRGWRSRTDRERLVYEKILPELPLAPIEFYGFIPADEGAAWLFIEEVQGASYCAERPDHRALAGRSLAQLHIAGATIEECAKLDSPGPDRFHASLALTPILLERAVANESLSPADIEVLDEIRFRCDQVAARWEDLEALSTESPQTLVHGDFKEDNVIVDADVPPRGLFLLDWAECGYGSPALDLAKFLGYSIRPQLEAYCSVVRDQWPAMNQDRVRRLAYLGDLLRCLESIRWIAGSLTHEWVEKPIRKMRIYRRWLHELVAAAPWDRASTCRPHRTDLIPRSWH